MLFVLRVVDRPRANIVVSRERPPKKKNLYINCKERKKMEPGAEVFIAVAIVVVLLLVWFVFGRRHKRGGRGRGWGRRNKWSGKGACDGRDGRDGDAGRDGEPGPRGFPGFNGATGGQGSQGRTGSQGPQGPQGPQGSFGAQGTQGSFGAQGTQGSFGAQGTQGGIGVQGLLGLQGVQGLLGVQGLQGAQGPQGGFGATGATGDTGTVGIAGAGAIIPYSSGAPGTLVTVTALVPGTAALTAFGDVVPVTEFSFATIDLAGGPGVILDQAYSVPRAGTLSRLDVTFSVVAATGFPQGETHTISTSIYSAASVSGDTTSNLFTQLSASVDFEIPPTTTLPAGSFFAGFVPLAIPVAPPMRLLLVTTLSAVSDPSILAATVDGYISAGLAIA